MTLVQAKGEVSQQILHLRSIERIIASDELHKLFNQATDEDKLKAINYIKQRDKESLIVWMKNQSRQSDISLLGLRELRTLANEVGVPRFMYKQKDDLIYEINKVKHS
jgi:tRNA C32,U32 (ribose-2'-O)-methylase TrmJ